MILLLEETKFEKGVNEELIYVGITRAKNRLYILNEMQELLPFLSKFKIDENGKIDFFFNKLQLLHALFA